MKPILLDVSRTVSRVFKPVATGIDRVENRYIDFALERGQSWFVAKLKRDRLALMDAQGMAGVRDCIRDGNWDDVGRFHLLGSGSNKGTARRNRTIERLATKVGTGRMVSDFLKGLPDNPCTYVNVGHTHLGDSWLRQLGNRRRIVMIHDMIPLDTPQLQTDQSARTFEQRMRAVSASADCVIANSKYTASCVERWFAEWGRVPEISVIHLGIEPADENTKPGKKDNYFIALGTIEPRKGHALLLDVWDRLLAELGDQTPRLHVVGARGWGNEEVFRRLDFLAKNNGPVIEHGALSDTEMQPLLANARALLFPSQIEGFGLPVLEALQLGTPVIANDLPVLREIAGDSVLYTDSQDANDWSTIIKNMARTSRISGINPNKARAIIPRWSSHFDRLESLIG